jgi:hypothetical protein
MDGFNASRLTARGTWNQSRSMPATPESILHTVGLMAHHQERNDPGLAHD